MNADSHTITLADARARIDRRLEQLAETPHAGVGRNDRPVLMRQVDKGDIMDDLWKAVKADSHTITLADARHLFPGFAPATWSMWARSGELQATKSAGGQWLTTVKEARVAAESHSPKPRKSKET